MTIPTTIETKSLAIGSVKVDLPDVTQVQEAAKQAIEHHAAYAGTIDCPELYAFVGQELLSVKTQLKTYKAQRDGLLIPFQNIKREAQTGMNNATNLFAPVIQYLERSERLLKTERERWETVEERRVQEERRLAAVRQQEETRRVAEEARRRGEEARMEAEERQRESQAALAAGRAAEARKLAEDAEQIIETAQAQNEMEAEIADITSQSAAAIRAEMPKTAGISSKKRWVAEFTDLRALLAGILAGEIPIAAVKAKVDGKIQPASTAKLEEIEQIIIARSWFNDEAADKGDTMNYPGVRAYERRETAVTA